jgi:cysteine synthase A
MISVPDAASIAVIREIEPLLGRRVGASTGTNLYGALRIACEMRAAGTKGSIVTLLCDGGERYADTYYSDDWLVAQGIDVTPYRLAFAETLRTGTWTAG